MPRPRLRHLVLFVALAVSAACASAASNNGPKITPPQRLRAGPPPEIREQVDIRIEVLIDAEGQPDLKTLRVTGLGSGSARSAIEEWIRSSTFKPAMQDGHPVSAPIQLGLKTEIRRVRM